MSAIHKLLRPNQIAPPCIIHPKIVGSTEIGLNNETSRITKATINHHLSPPIKANIYQFHSASRKSRLTQLND